MPLPVINQSTFTSKVPSTGEEVSFVPFTVNHKKQLLLAFESRSEIEVIKAMAQCVDSCIKSASSSLKHGSILKYKMYDCQSVFLDIRAKSIGELIEQTIPCAKCNQPFIYELNIEQLKLSDTKDEAKTVKINDQVGMILESPSIEDILRFSISDEKAESENETKTDILFRNILRCISSIYDGDVLFKPGVDYTDEELADFVGQLPGTVLEDIEDFIDSIPSIQIDIKFTCPACGYENFYDGGSIADFFQS